MRTSKTDTAVIGLPELRAKLAQLTKDVYGEEAGRIYLTAARKIRDAARRLAPISKWPVVSRVDKGKMVAARSGPGALRQAIVAYGLSAKRKEFGPAAIAQVNIFKGRNRAPHGHLVEFGTRARAAKNGKLMPFPAMGGTRLIFAREVKGMEANPFFSHAIQLSGMPALEAAMNAHLRILVNAGVKST